LSARDSTGLHTWLTREHYKIPDGAEPLLRPYVEAGSKFFVAKVDPAKVAFQDGRAALSPLRFHYDSDEFALPIRLGLASSSGTQDLIVSILAPHQRYEVANYKNVTIPTNLDVRDSVKDRFAAFYTALFDRTLEINPGAVVTEYAWQASGCDPCPGPTLNQGDFATLGADAIGGARERPSGYRGGDLVLTRLHARYGTAISQDLVFRAADPIAGGREFLQNGQGGVEDGARPAPQNNFQGRYAIRHPWTGPIRCEHPVRRQWGGPPPEVASQPGFIAAGIRPAVGLAFAPRGQVELAQVVGRDVPEIKLVVSRSVEAPPPSAVGSGSRTPAGAGSAAAAPPIDRAAPRSGCGCASAGGGGGGGLAGALVILAAWSRARAARGRGRPGAAAARCKPHSHSEDT
ncbi:MAG TPA: DUF2330 domain-containing protein, partial [Kofleriaceae bacterium]|nr:DUF2330 domain-containing protein [Kofleriaceae bacterium]